MMNFADKANGRALNDRVTELLSVIENHEKVNNELRNDITNTSRRLKEVLERLYAADTIITTWFEEHFEETHFEPITVDLDDVNNLMKMLGFATINAIRTWAVQVEYSGHGTVYVKASSEDEAMQLVEDESIHVEYAGICEDSEFSYYDSSINALSAEISN